ncbi:MAG: exodeoxyribonuclease VII large subunit [Armatimonadota bacterium]
MGLTADNLTSRQRESLPDPLAAVLSVREVTAHVKRLLDSSELLQDISVRGELSNFKRHTSGHLYFSLKDEASQLSCVMFRGMASRLRFDPEDGMMIVASGNVSVYERGGRYQLYVRHMQPEGRGDLYAAFEALKGRLQEEGLFDAERKRPLPRFPRRIAVLTSPTGAAIRDIATILARRFPPAVQVHVPTIVQGEQGADSIVEALRVANDSLDDVDVIILGRGGGSIEDLWCFNEEKVARAIAASRVPVVSAVGHETDFTIADFVADVRAPTPSAAAEMVVPDRREVLDALMAGRRRLTSALTTSLDRWRRRLDAVLARRSFRFPTEQVQQAQQGVDDVASRIAWHYARGLEQRRSRLDGLEHKLRALGPLQTLERGYVLCERTADGKVITRVAQLRPRDEVGLRFADGVADAEVTQIQEGQT